MSTTSTAHAAAPELLAEVRRLTAEAAELRRERDELAAQVHIVTSERDELASGMQALRARLAEIEQAVPAAWIEHELQGTGLRHLHFERRPNQLRDDVIAPVWTALIPRPAPAAAPERAADLNPDSSKAQHISRPACDWPGKCAHKRPAQAAAPELAEPADPRTPPPGCRLLGDYEPARAGDMAYIGAIGGRWRRVRPRMGIIGATMDELSDGARVLALARPCRCPRGEQ